MGVMTYGRLKAKIRKLEEEHEEEEMESGELNLVPYLDIVTNVIMFLLMTTTFSAAIADINVSAPSTSSRPDVAVTPPDQQPHNDLNLTVQISDKGYIIAASGAVLFENDVVGKLPTIPKKNGEYDYAALTKKMSAIKDNFKDETKVIINANADITYENVVNAMDAIRNDGGRVLFPDVLLSAGVN